MLVKHPIHRASRFALQNKANGKWLERDAKKWAPVFREKSRVNKDS